MQLVNAFSEEYEDNVNYDDFLTMVDRHGGDYGGHEFKFHQTANDKISEMRRGGGITTDNRELIGKIQQVLNQATGGIVGVE